MNKALITLNRSQVFALTRLFSPSVLKEMAKTGKSSLFAQLITESSLNSEISPTAPIYDAFEIAFSILRKKGNRNEYVYKSTIAKNVLLGIHSLHSASMLTEFRTVTSKADVVILNGTSTVYEIKSERDNLDRLPSQIEAYRQVFAKINIITGDNHLDAILRAVPDDVGIMSLTNRHQISTIREATENIDQIRPSAVFDSLQLREAKKVLELYDINTPKVPNTQLGRTLQTAFNNLTPYQAHNGMIKILKETRSLIPLSDLLNTLPTSLKAAVLSTKIRRCDHSKLIRAMNTPLQTAINWG